MKIAFYAPFKPLGHPHPSGDLVIATGLHAYLAGCGHDIRMVSTLRARWIYRRPWNWLSAIREYRRAGRRLARWRPDCWLTYHTYYKAPDVLGPDLSKCCGIPYLIFQGIYSTKRRKNWRTRPGFYLNRRALSAARHVFSNRKMDLKNLRRLLPEDRLTYVPPGIYPADFRFDPRARQALRRAWKTGDEPVILSAAMFRPDVKSQGLDWTIRSCGRLFREGLSFYLVIAGEGKERDRLVRLAEAYLPDRCRFVGKVSREEMHRFYSAGDLFVFPGIRESLGMVFLESQSCGLPVAAFDNGGIPEVVKDGVTGLLTPPFDAGAFDRAVRRLVTDSNLRERMGTAAAFHVREHHDLARNYRRMETVLVNIVNRNLKNGRA
ncbi:MAG: glycosyltransferase family 4 protein [Desulfococcaceae bacterium]